MVIESKTQANCTTLSDKSIEVLINAIKNNNGYIYPLPKKIEEERTLLIWNDVIFPLLKTRVASIEYEIKEKEVVEKKTEEGVKSKSERNKKEDKKNKADKNILVCPIIIYFYRKYGKKDFVKWMRNYCC